MRALSSQLQIVVFDHYRHDNRLRDFDSGALQELISDCVYAIRSNSYSANDCAIRASLLFKAARELERRHYGLALNP